MKATFTPIGDASMYIFQHAVGHVLTVQVPGTDDRRVVLILSDEDHAKVGDGMGVGQIEVTDLMTGERHRLVGAPCGLGCRCAITFAPERS